MTLPAEKSQAFRLETSSRDLNGNAPWWARFVERVGVPAGLAAGGLIVIYVLVSQMARSIDKLTDKVAEQTVELRKLGEKQDRTNFLLEKR